MSNQTNTQTKTEDRVYEKPVAWLLGRQLVASLKATLLYTAYGPKLEARDWMVAKVFPSDDQEKANAFWKKRMSFGSTTLLIAAME